MDRHVKESRARPYHSRRQPLLTAQSRQTRQPPQARHLTLKFYSAILTYVDMCKGKSPLYLRKELMTEIPPLISTRTKHKPYAGGI